MLLQVIVTSTNVTGHKCNGMRQVLTLIIVPDADERESLMDDKLLLINQRRMLHVIVRKQQSDDFQHM